MEQRADTVALRSHWRGAACLGGPALGAALAATMLLPAVFGMQRYVVTGGSMGETIPRGSVAFERPVPVARLRIGDVITYTRPAGGRVTHRIVWIGRDRHGVRSFQTKGDANAARDLWRFTLGRATQPRVAFHVPLVGYPSAALSIRAVRILVIGVPALLVAIGALAGLRPRKEAVA